MIVFDTSKVRGGTGPSEHTRLYSGGNSSSSSLLARSHNKRVVTAVYRGSPNSDVRATVPTLSRVSRSPHRVTCRSRLTSVAALRRRCSPPPPRSARREYSGRYGIRLLGCISCPGWSVLYLHNGVLGVEPFSDDGPPGAAAPVLLGHLSRLSPES